MAEIIDKIGVDELKSNPPVIERKFILIDSSLYTDEAYEYLLDLINETDSIAFIRDRKKIYTHGEYFGGDIWQDSLFYFGNFQILDNNSDEVLTDLKAEIQSETIRFKGENHIQLLPEEVWINGSKYKTIKFSWDIDNSIDKSIIKIDDPSAEYNLEIKDNKISVNKYIPIRVEIPTKFDLIEYDSDISSINFDLNIYTTEDNYNIFVTSSNEGDTVNLSEDNKKVFCKLNTKNINTDYLVIYSDYKNEGSIKTTLKYGFANVCSSEEITSENFISLENRFLSENSCSCEFDLNIEDDKYGWFACPIGFKPKFIDKDTNISGGWKKVETINVYSTNLEYDVYKTENSGLGNTSWKIID